MTKVHYTRIAQLRTAEQFRAYIAELGIDLKFDESVEAGTASPLAQPYHLDDRVIGNRFAVLPMEGWDATVTGDPTELTQRRWQNFGLSGAKLIWGGEAVAVRPDGRANPNQLLLNGETMKAVGGLRQTLLEAHRQAHGSTDDLLVGLQLTHSGRFARPNFKDKLEPKILYQHPFLNARYQLAPDQRVMSDAEIDSLIDDFVLAARRANDLGYDFIDVKHCHGYLGHEFLSAVNRPGRYGGSFENRTRFLREVVAGVRRDVAQLRIGVRLSAFDMLPFTSGSDGVGVPETWQGDYPYAFGSDHRDPLAIDLRETEEFLQLLVDLKVQLVCITAGSPYYNPHIQRPALFPPSDGYRPPEDPLVGVSRQLMVTARLKAKFPQLTFVGSGYSYLQEWLPHVAQYQVRTGGTDFAGVGRLVLSYPELPADVLTGRSLKVKKLCRTFSDCTSGPRAGLISGCYPLDPFYKAHPHHELLKNAKQPRNEAG